MLIVEVYEYYNLTLQICRQLLSFRNLLHQLGDYADENPREREIQNIAWN